MAPKYTHAIVQRISPALSTCGDINIDAAKKQHEGYVNLLREIGLDVIELPPDDELPEGVFVENAAVICNGVALIAKSDEPTRQKENDAMKIILKKELDIPCVDVNESSALLDGGDVLFTGREFFVGLSSRTNEGGAVAIAEAFPEYPCAPIKISGDKRLKYYVTMAGSELLCVSHSKDSQEVLKRIERVASFSYQTLTLSEEFAANVLYVNGTLIHRPPMEIPYSYKIIKSKVDCPSRNVEMAEISGLSSGLTSFCLLLRRWKSVRSI